MNIAVDVIALNGDGSAGGITWMAMELIKGFADYGNTNVTVLCRAENIDFLRTYIGTKVQYKKVSPENKKQNPNIINRTFNRLMCIKLIKKIIRQGRFDILYFPLGVVDYHVRGVKTISTILDVQHEFYPSFFTKRELIARRLIYRAIARNSRKVVCISEYTKKTFCEKYNYPLERAEVIYIAIQNRFDVCDDRILERLDLRDNGYIIYPANFWQHKNHKRLISAFAKYGGNSDIKLVLTGNMLSRYEKLSKYIENSGMQDKIVITGYLDEKQLFALLKCCRGLIFPSLFEGFGIPVIEAMQLYKPIACSNTTSLPEIGCESLFYFNPMDEDDICRGIRFVADTKMTDEMFNDYNENLKRFDRDSMIEGYMSVFREVCSR
mgnify:FL=1